MRRGCEKRKHVISRDNTSGRWVIGRLSSPVNGLLESYTIFFKNSTGSNRVSSWNLDLSRFLTNNGWSWLTVLTCCSQFCFWSRQSLNRCFTLTKTTQRKTFSRDVGYSEKGFSALFQWIWKNELYTHPKPRNVYQSRSPDHVFLGFSLKIVWTGRKLPKLKLFRKSGTV